jgi:DNA-directed RNA polymerase alpha subunit
MPKVDTDKFIALLIETYCRRMGIDRTIVATILDDVLEQMGFRVENGEIVEIPGKAPRTPGHDNELLDRKLVDFALTVRTINVLGMNDIKTLRDLVRLHRTDFLKLRSTGKKTCKEIDEFLLDHDLRWGMDV